MDARDLIGPVQALVIGPIRLVDWGDGLGPWNTLFGAGYPDWLVEAMTGRKLAPLPDALHGFRQVFTGREIVPCPEGLFEFFGQTYQGEWVLSRARP